jgi:hypothetical protein
MKVMKDRELTETQIENLIELVNELQGKLKKKNLQLAILRGRLNKAKLTIKLQKCWARRRVSIH